MKAKGSWRCICNSQNFVSLIQTFIALFKTQLSSNLVPEKVLIAAVWVIAIFSWQSVPGFFSPFVVILLAFILVLYSIYIVYIAAINISYDARHLFIADRKTERIIPLANVTQVKRSFNLASPRTRWRITYVDPDGTEAELFFYPDDSVAMTVFVRTVRKENPIADCD